MDLLTALHALSLPVGAGIIAAPILAFWAMR